MATLLLKMNLAGLTKTQIQNFERSDDAAGSLLDRLRGLAIASQPAGKTQVTLTALENGTQAAGTVTAVTVANNSTVVVGNITLTGKTSAPSGQAQFLCGVSATADAAALRDCINNHSTLSTWFIATSAAGVCTITALDFDTRANAYALTSSDGTNLAVAGFSGGVLDTKSITYVCG